MKNISCPRCRKTVDHAQKFMQEVKSTDRKIAMGICDHCRKKATTKTITTVKTIKKPFCACDEIVKKIISIKGEQKEDIKEYVKIWLLKMGHLLKDDITLNKPKQVKSRAYYDLQIDLGLNSPASRHEPAIQQMFHSGMHKSDINLNTEIKGNNLKEDHMKQAVAFFQPIEHVEITFAQTPLESEKINIMIPRTLLEDSNTTFVETYVKELPRTSLKARKQDIFEDEPSIDAKEALKRRHDLSLRQMLRLEKDSGFPYSVSKRPDIYETPKITPKAQKEPTLKYHAESYLDIKIPTLKYDRSPRGTRDLDYVLNREVKFMSTRASQDSYYESRKADKYHHVKIKQGLYDSEKGPKKVKKLEDRYTTDKELKLQHSSRKVKKSDQHVAKSKSWHTKATESKESVEFVLKPQYSFVFPKVMEKEEKQVKVDVSSSHIIKDIQEKFHLQAERIMKIREEERLQKLEQDQKKKLAREEKKLQAEGKNKQAVEDNKYAKDQKRQHDIAKGHKTKRDSFDKDGKMFSESEQKGKISKESRVARKDTKSEPERIYEELDKAKKDIKSKPEQTDKTAELLQKAKKDLKYGTENADKTTEFLQKAKKDLKYGPKKGDKTAELFQKAKKDLKSDPEKGDRTTELLQKAKKGFISEPEKGDKTPELLQKAKKDLKSEPEQGDETAELLQKAKKDLKSEPEQVNKTAKLLQIAKKDLKSEPEKRDKIDEVLENTKKDVEERNSKLKGKGDEEVIDKEKKGLKEKPIQKIKDDYPISKAMKYQQKKGENLKSTKKGSKDLKPRIEQKDKISVLEEPKKDFKEKSEQNVKVENKEQKAKTGKELEEKLRREKEYKERLKQLEQSKLSKQIKSTKKNLDSPEEIKVSMSRIQKSINKGGKDEYANQREIFKKIQEVKKETEGKQKKYKVEPSQQQDKLKKIEAELLKEKQETFKKKKQQEYEAKVAKALKEAKYKSKALGRLSDIKIQPGFSEDNLSLRLVPIKQAATIKPPELDAELIKEHMSCHHKMGQRDSLCPLCLNSELELDVLNKISPPKEIITDIIKGEKIFKIKPRLEKSKEPEIVSKLYRKICFVESDLPPTEIYQIVLQTAEPVQKLILSKNDAKEIEMEHGKGVLRYALSDRTFIEKGWTMLPTEKVVRKINVYRMRPAHPEFDWFEHNKNKQLMTYDTGERLAEFDHNGRGRWYYRNGRLALDYYDAEEANAQQRFVIYSSGEPDERGRTHPITILATFDYLGNGIVFDHTGKIRLKYNQTEGVVLDRGIGPVSHWKWHSLNDPPVLQQVMIDTQMAHKDPNILKLGTAADRTTRPDNEEMLAIEFDNFIKEKSKKLSQTFKPFQIKMKALKINEHFSLKVLDQATIYLIFRDGVTNLKLNIGMILDHQEIVDTDTAEVGEVSNSLERFPARTDSLAGLQRSVAHAQRYERQHAERERRLRPAEPCASADHLTAAASPAMRLPLRTVPTGSSSSIGYCCRKPTNNLYYNTRLL